MNFFAIPSTLLSILLFVSPAFGQSIGSGNPGLKVVTGRSGAVAIYQDEPQTFGTGLMGGMKDRKIKVIIDQGYNFDQANMEIAEQLYPFDHESAFSRHVGTWAPGFKQWDYSRRKSLGFRLVGSHVITFFDLQNEAALKYHLSPGDEFLGCIDNRVFYWKKFDPSRLYWRELAASRIYSFQLPKTVIDLYGVARGRRKEIGLLTFSKSHGWFRYSPYTTESIEFNLTQGVVFAP